MAEVKVSEPEKINIRPTKKLRTLLYQLINK